MPKMICFAAEAVRIKKTKKNGDEYLKCLRTWQGEIVKIIGENNSFKMWKQTLKIIM